MSLLNAIRQLFVLIQTFCLTGRYLLGLSFSFNPYGTAVASEFDSI